MKLHIRSLASIGSVALAGLLYLSPAAAAPPVKVTVTGAAPDSALQGEALDVDISGSGFDIGSTVRFLVSGTKDDSQITVAGAVYDAGTGILTASIQIEGAALIADYDIEVQALSGRKGKGTTLFKVFSSNGGGNSEPLDTASCDELFGFAPGTCTAEGTSDPCMFTKDFNDAHAWKMTQHCDTRAMLVARSDDPILYGGDFRLNLVGPWLGGSAAISNSRGANRIGNFHVRVSDASIAGGCGSGPVQAAVAFDPDLEPKSGAPRGGTGDFKIEALGGARFCYGILFIGSDPYIVNPYKQVGIGYNHILANSYERVGIWMANINMSDLNDQVRNEFARIAGNIVEATDSPCATSVLVGPNVERPQVLDNLVYAASGAGCAGRTVGIGVLASGRNMSGVTPDYDFLTDKPAKLSGNTVMTGGGGSIGILVDGATDAESTGNQVTAGDPGDYAVCVETGGDFAEIKKGSEYIGFAAGNQVVNTADCGEALP